MYSWGQKRPKDLKTQTAKAFATWRVAPKGEKVYATKTAAKNILLRAGWIEFSECFFVNKAITTWRQVFKPTKGRYRILASPTK